MNMDCIHVVTVFRICMHLPPHAVPGIGCLLLLRITVYIDGIWRNLVYGVSSTGCPVQAIIHHES